MKKTTVVLATITTLAITTPAFGFMCDGGVIRNGDSIVTVIRKCGEPEHKDTVSGETEGTKVEKWYIKPGYSSFTRVLTIRNGVVVKIKTLRK